MPIHGNFSISQGALKKSVRIGANSSTKYFRIRVGIMSGPDVLLGLIFLVSSEPLPAELYV